MATWLEKIQVQMAALSPEGFAEPECEVGENEHVVGEASESLKRLFTVAQSYVDLKVQKLGDALKAIKNREESAKLRDEANDIGAEAKLLTKIFWQSVRDEYPELADKPEIGIRKGWKVLWKESSGEEELLDIFEQLFARARA